MEVICGVGMNELIVLDNTSKGKKEFVRLKTARQFHAYRDRLSGILSSSKVYCIGRSSNIDGTFGPALIMHNYNIKRERTFFTQQDDYPTVLKELKKAKVKNSFFIVSDLSVNIGNLAESKKLLSFLKLGNNAVIWLDHHPWDSESLNAVKDMFYFLIFGESDRYCATDLVYLLLCKSDHTGKRIAKIAHYSDFPFLTNRYRKVTDRLSYAIVNIVQNRQNRNARLRKFTYLASGLQLGNRFIGNNYKEYMKKEKENMKLLFKNSHRIVSGSCSVGIGFSRTLQANSACYAIRKKLKTDIAIYINIEIGKCGIRSNDYVDSSLLAEKLGGGGHPHASGFKVKPSEFRNFNKNSMEKFVKKVEAISKALYG